MARQQSQSSPDPAGKDSATSSPILTEDGTSVRLSFQSCSLLLLADESSGVTVRMKLFRDFNLLAAGWWWNSWCLSSVVWRVRSMRQATVLLMYGGAIPASKCTLSKFVGLRQPEMIRQQSCRAGLYQFQLGRVCRPCPHRAGVFGSWVAEGETAGSECRCLAPPLRVREFTDDVISRVHLHLCLLDVRFIAQSSVKVDAQVHGCCCVWESGTVPHYIQFSFGFSVP